MLKTSKTQMKQLLYKIITFLEDGDENNENKLNIDIDIFK
jgi:hypothetical protein